MNKKLLSIFFLAVLLRVAFALILGNTLDPLKQARIYDQVSYNALAHSILAGRGYSFDQPWYPFGLPTGSPTAHWSFLYPLYLAGVYAVAGFHPLVARLVQAVLAGLLSSWLVYRLGRRMFGENVGLIAAFLLAVYPYLVYHDAALMTEAFYIAGTLASFDLALQLAEEPRSPLRKWLLLGFVLGLSALLRQTILLWAPFLLGWVFFNRARREISAIPNTPNVKSSTSNSLSPGKFQNFKFEFRNLLLVLIPLAALILPWTVRNWLVYGAFLPLNSNMGYAIYSANHPNQGVNFDQDYAAPLPADLDRQDLNEAELNTELTRRGLDFILSDPVRYLRLSLDRIPIFFNFWFSSESDTTSNLMRIFSFGLFLPFFIAGLFLARRTPGGQLLLMYLLVYSALHILSWASIRYRLPIDAALMPAAALSVKSFFGKAFSTHRTPRAARATKDSL